MIINPQFYKSIHNDTAKPAVSFPLMKKIVKQHFVKVVVSFVVFLIMFTSFFMMGTKASQQHPTPASINEQVIVVGSGDTLWAVASKYRQPSDDIRFMVYLIKERNNLSDSSIKPGQKLIIPSM